jgi:hypothetical protein
MNFGTPSLKIGVGSSNDMDRQLIIDETVKAEIARVVRYADAHWYRPARGEPHPTMNPAHEVTFPFGWRCVFSYTLRENEKVRGQLYRQLLVSLTVVGDPDCYPSPIAFFTIAELFGFTGRKLTDGIKIPEDWFVDINREERSIMILQETER